jgi:hypothetical protein
MAKQDTNISRTLVPEGGVEISLPEGKILTRIHLELSKDGITLSHVGAASAALPAGKRQSVVLKPGKQGVTLAVVGAASATK